MRKRLKMLGKRLRVFVLFQLSTTWLNSRVKVGAVVQQKIWHESRHCISGNDVFQTLNSMGITGKWDWAMQHSVLSRVLFKSTTTFCTIPWFFSDKLKLSTKVLSFLYFDFQNFKWICRSFHNFMLKLGKCIFVN